MTHKVVDMERRPQEHRAPPVSDFWFAQLDHRLRKIEFIVIRLEWQFLIIACGAFGLLVFEIVRAVSGG